MSKKKVNLVVNLNDVPEELAKEILDRVQTSITSILEEYGITGVKCDRKAEYK